MKSIIAISILLFVYSIINPMLRKSKIESSSTIAKQLLFCSSRNFFSKYMLFRNYSSHSYHPKWKERWFKNLKCSVLSRPVIICFVSGVAIGGAMANMRNQGHRKTSEMLCKRSRQVKTVDDFLQHINDIDYAVGYYHAYPSKKEYILKRSAAETQRLLDMFFEQEKEENRVIPQIEQYLKYRGSLADTLGRMIVCNGNELVARASLDTHYKDADLIAMLIKRKKRVKKDLIDVLAQYFHAGVLSRDELVQHKRISEMFRILETLPSVYFQEEMMKLTCDKGTNIEENRIFLANIKKYPAANRYPDLMKEFEMQYDETEYKRRKFKRDLGGTFC